MNYYLLRPSLDGETSTGRKFHCSSITLDCPGNSFVEKNNNKELQFIPKLIGHPLTFINTLLLQANVGQANK